MNKHQEDIDLNQRGEILEFIAFCIIIASTYFTFYYGCRGNGQAHRTENSTYSAAHNEEMLKYVQREDLKNRLNNLKKTE